MDLNYDMKKSLLIIQNDSWYMRRKLGKLVDDPKTATLFLDSLFEELEKGASVQDIFESQYGGFFPPHVWGIITTGLQTGKAKHAVDNAEAALNAGYKPISFLWERLIFLFFELTLIIGFQIFLFVGIFPKFNAIMSSLCCLLPEKFINFRDVCIVLFYIIITATLVSGVLIFLFVVSKKLWRKREFFFKWWERGVLAIPVFGNSYRYELFYSFFSSAAELLENGYSEKETLNIIESNAESIWLRKRCEKMMRLLEKGLSFNKAIQAVFRKEKLIRKYSGLLAAGSYNTYISSLRNFSMIAQNRNEEDILRAGQTIPSLLLIINGLFVGFIYILMFLPIIVIEQAVIPT
jgi:type II secretory pathway component PulF